MKQDMSEYDKKIEAHENFIYVKIAVIIIGLMLIFFVGCALFLSIQFLF